MTIALQNITKMYAIGEQSVCALRGISLGIETGELVAIMGPSGSGKSTLMNIIGCLDQPTSGTYQLDGVEIAGLSDDDLAQIRNHKIGFVFQSYNLLPRLPAIDQVELPLLYRDGVSASRHDRAVDALQIVGLGERMRHRPTELSGGQSQRVAIARALVTDPSLILADEPTGALDSRTSEDIMALLQHLNESRGLTVVLITHEPSVAECTRRLIRLRDGLIVSDERQEARPAAAVLAAAA